MSSSSFVRCLWYKQVTSDATIRRDSNAETKKNGTATAFQTLLSGLSESGSSLPAAVFTSLVRGQLQQHMGIFIDLFPTYLSVDW